VLIMTLSMSRHSCIEMLLTTTSNSSSKARSSSGLWTSSTRSVSSAARSLSAAQPQRVGVSVHPHERTTGIPSCQLDQPDAGAGADRAAGRGGRRGLADPDAVLGGTRNRLGREPGRARPRRAQPHARAGRRPALTNLDPAGIAEEPSARTTSQAVDRLQFPLAQVRQMIADGHPWFAEMDSPQWSFLELPTGHWPMFSEPDRLADLLLHLPANRKV
jgi:hypothetical protein